jgi:uncharacterized protein
VSGSRGRSRIFSRAATVIAAGVVTGWAFALIDLERRFREPHTPLVGHLEGSLALFTIAGAGLGLVAAAVWLAERALSARVARSRAKLSFALSPLIYGVIGAGLSASTAFWLFSGGRVSSSRAGHYGPYLSILAMAAGAAVLALGASYAARSLQRGRWVLPVILGLVALGAAFFMVRTDLTVLVALYNRLHTLIEATAAVTVLTVLGVAFGSRSRTSRSFAATVEVVTSLSLGWLFVFLALHAPKHWLDKKLRHVWLEPVYAGRMLARAQTLETYLKNPAGWQGAEQSGLDRLRDRFDIGSTALSPVWEAPLSEPAPFRQKINALRKRPKSPPSILFFYVDTLRADVASEQNVMPNYTEFAQESLHFMHAYSAGSDTVHALPALTGGAYEPGPDPKPNDILEVARATHTRTALVIGQSAREFLGKEAPGFHFDDTLTVPDYDTERKDVWGYGADRSSAAGVVDRSLEWLREHKDEHFLLWSFNFDVHNWREINDGYLADTARERGLPLGPGFARYRVAAAGVDRAFGRLLKGLDELGLRDDVIVVFVSDHGEGVGRDGFWVHAIFLWEALIRVPLAIRIPGVEPKVIWDQVSLVDVAPTLTRYLDAKVDTRGYQGEDLLGYLVANRPKRRLPLLTIGTARDGVRRVGMIEPGTQWKLVLQLESGTPELYDVNAADPDWDNLAEDNPTQTLTMLSQLVRSPIFPRKKEDRDVKERAELATAPQN